MRVKRWEITLIWFLLMFIMFALVSVVDKSFELREAEIDRQILIIDHKLWKTQNQNEQIEAELEKSKRNIEYVKNLLSDIPEHSDLEAEIDALYQYIIEVDAEVSRLVR